MTDETITRPKEEQGLLERFTLSLIDSGLSTRDLTVGYTVQKISKVLEALSELKTEYPGIVKAVQRTYKADAIYYDEEIKRIAKERLSAHSNHITRMRTCEGLNAECREVSLGAIKVLDGLKTIEDWKTESEK